VPVIPLSKVNSSGPDPKTAHPERGRTNIGYVFELPGLTPPCAMNGAIASRALLSLLSQAGICEPWLIWYPNRASLSSVGLIIDVTPRLMIFGMRYEIPLTPPGHRPGRTMLSSY